MHEIGIFKKKRRGNLPEKRSVNTGLQFSQNTQNLPKRKEVKESTKSSASKKRPGRVENPKESILVRKNVNSTGKKCVK